MSRLIRCLPGCRVVVWLVAALLPGVGLAAPFAAMVPVDGPALAHDELAAAYRPLVGRPLDAGLTAELVRVLDDHYRRQGYLPPTPRVAGQRDAAGIVLMEVREAHVADVRVAGAAHLPPDTRARIVELERMQPLSRAAFDHWLQQANRSGVAVRGSLSRVSADSSGYVASLRVEPRRWWGLLHVDNRAPAQLGRELAQVSLAYRWPSEGLGELRFDMAVAADPQRLRYGRLSASHRLGRGGERLRWSYARSESMLPVAGSDAPVDYARQRAELQFERPLLQRLRQRSTIAATLRSYDLDRSVAGGGSDRERIRVVELGYSHLLAAGGGRHGLEVSLSHGLGGLGAMLADDSAGRTAEFLLLAGRYRLQRALGGAWRLRGDVHLQIAADGLPSSERFFVGGRRLGGAFDPATLGGDHGVGGRLEVERDALVAGRALTAFAYYDHAYVRSHDRTLAADDAGSAGAGVRGGFGGLAWQLELAAPVVEPATATLLEDDARVFFTLTQRF